MGLIWCQTSLVMFIFVCFLQMHVPSLWTETQLPSLSLCMNVELEWHGSGSHSCTPVILSGLRVSPRCCVSKASGSVTTGRWSGRGAGWMWLCLWGGSIVGRALTSVGLVPLNIPGFFTALMTTTALSMTTSPWTYQHPCLAPTGLECTWTGQGAPCPSTVSPVGPSATFTHSIAPSPSPSTLALGWRVTIALFLYVQWRAVSRAQRNCDSWKENNCKSF